MKDITDVLPLPNRSLPPPAQSAVPVMDAAMPAAVMPAQSVLMAVVGPVPAVVDAAEVVEAQSKVEGDRRPDIRWRAVGERIRVVGPGRWTINGAAAQRTGQQKRKYQAFRGALPQDVHDRTFSNTLSV